MGAGVWRRHFYVISKRNISIIFRNKILIVLEVFSPLLLIVLLAGSVNNSALNRLKEKGRSIYYLSPDDGVIKMYFISPNSSLVKRLMIPILSINNAKVKYFADETEASSEYLRISHNDVIGIHFLNKTAYALRFPQRMLPTKRNRFADFSRKCVINHSLEQCSSTSYKRSGFAWLQQQINFEIIKSLKLKRNTSLHKTVVFEALDSHLQVGSFYYTLASFCLIILYIGLLNTLVVSLVGEKESNMVKYMNIMGLTISAYYFSWGLIYSLFVLVVSGSSCLLMLNVFVLKHTNFILLLIFLFLYGLSFVAMGKVIVDCFTNANVAGHIVSYLIITYSLIYVFVSRFEFGEGNQFSDLYRLVPFYVLVISGIFSPIAFLLGINQIMSLESNGRGLTMETLLEEKYSVLLSISMITFDFIMYIVTSLAIIKFKEFKMQINCNRRMSECPSNEQEMVTGLPRDKVLGFDNDSSTDEFYRVPAISVRKLCKIFNKGKSEQITALDDLNLNIFENEVTAVIGHNGAGKTTLFNILAGISSPTSGMAEINGIDVSDLANLESVRSIIGYCPQQDMLHPDLTSQEHLQFFMQIKNLGNTSKWTEELVPSEVKDVLISQLSVGQKQKLKLAIALIGNPKILILDEPTSGMDILARGTFWKILNQYKYGKAVLLSTHLMDEADCLADKKAILSNGLLQCCGSSLFLKNHFGIGYHLSLSVDCPEKFEEVEALVKSYVPESAIECKTKNDIIFNLPLSSRNKFAALFMVIEDIIMRKDVSLGIERFNVTLSSLEEILLRIHGDGVQNESLPGLDTQEIFEEGNTSKPNIISQFSALVKRKLKDGGRDLSFLFAKLTFPILFMICFVISNKLISIKYPQEIDGSPFKLDSSLCDSSKRNVIRYSNVDLDGLDDLQNFSLSEFGSFQLAINVTNKNFIGVYQDMFLHALPVLVSSISNLILETDYLVKNTSLLPTILTFNWVWPSTKKDSRAINAQQMSQMLYFISFSILTVSSMFSTSVVAERNKNCLRQLKLANVNGLTYWLANVISDCVQMVVPLILSLMVFFAGQRYIISALYYFIVLFILLQFMPCLLLFSYFISLLSTKKTFVQFYTTIIFYLLGLALHFYLEINFPGVPFLLKCFISTINPPYGLIVIFDSFQLLFEILHYDDSDAGIQYYFKGYYFICFASPWISSVLYLSLLASFDKLIEFGFLNHVKTRFEAFPFSRSTGGSTLFLTDSARFANASTDDGNLISAKRLSKVYGGSFSKCLHKKKKSAVNNVTFNISKGESLGLLGPNGAGKSTLVGMIVNNVTPTKGKVEICGKSQTLCGENVFSKLSFCPQENSCWDNLTVQEHLNLFLEIKGIKNEKKRVINYLIDELDLRKEGHKFFKNLSNGNKRKLCFAIGEICQSEAIVLDEPSSGLDPISRKRLWKLHKLLSARNCRGVLLSTHSIEEAEIFCSKLAVIVNGQIRFSGLTQQLKNHVDYGYTLEVKLNSSPDFENAVKMQRLKEFVSEILIPGAEVVNECYDWVAFKTTHNLMLTLSKVFYLLETNKDSLQISDYSFGRASLERIFLELFKFQTEDEPDDELNLVDVLPCGLRVDKNI